MIATFSASPHRASAERLVFLDWLRIYAFASVLAGHKFHEPVARAAQAETAWLRWPARLLWPFIEGGGVGVVVFFLISGYIITQVLQRESAPEFLLKRAFRIYPLYLVAVGIEFLILRSHGQGVGWQTLLQQMLLAGDFFGTPYALAGVEWTLRLEILFYLLMAGLRTLGLTRMDRVGPLAITYVLLIAALHFCGPLASHTAWTRGYLSLFMPFLLLGSMLWLYEKDAVNRSTMLAFILLTLVAYRVGLHAWQPRWLDAYFGVLGIAVFTCCWAVRQWLPAPAWVLALSELTYAVYLLHNWLFDVFLQALQRLGLRDVYASLVTLALLGAVCWLLVRCVERPGVRWGRTLASRMSSQAPALTPPEQHGRVAASSRTPPPASSRS